MVILRPLCNCQVTALASFCLQSPPSGCFASTEQIVLLDVAGQDKNSKEDKTRLRDQKDTCR